MFKKLILLLCLVSMLFAYTPVYAQVSSDTQSILDQISLLKEQLIQELIKQIAELQKQLADMIAVQTAQNTALQAQGAVLEQVVVNTTPKVIEPPVVCTPNWQCSEWNECADNSQARTCGDVNSCGITGKPELSRKCVSKGIITADLIGKSVKITTSGNSFHITSANVTTDIGKYSLAQDLRIKANYVGGINLADNNLVKGNILSVTLGATDMSSAEFVDLIVK